LKPFSANIQLPTPKEGRTELLLDPARNLLRRHCDENGCAGKAVKPLVKIRRTKRESAGGNSGVGRAEDFQEWKTKAGECAATE
jgi:hypothetical protein